LQLELQQLKQEMNQIKQIMKQNSRRVVKKTSVYLTPTERHVLQLVTQGLTNGEIAKIRNVSKDRIVRIVQKLYVETRTETRLELVRWAFDTGYASPSE
jgi:DNA-binding NarL/FixJ family response regulator